VSVYYAPRRPSLWDRLKTGAAAAVASPAGQAAIASAVQAALTGIVGAAALRRRPEPPDETDEALRRMLARIERRLEELPENEADAVRLTNLAAQGVRAATGRRGPEDQPQRTWFAPPETRGGSQGTPSEEGSGGDSTDGHEGAVDLSVACVPCARAHLVGVAAELDEATRFLPEAEEMIRERDEEIARARAAGETPPPALTVMDHPEIADRVHFAAREIVSLERRDWSPERILRTNAAEREVVMRYRPEVRELRQQVVNRVRRPEDLMRIAAQANDLWSRFEADSRGVVPDDAPGGEQLEEAAREFAASRHGGSVA